MSKKIFVTGTGTDVGKTYVTGLLIKKLAEYGKNCGYFKSAVSGNERNSHGDLIPGDAVNVKNISGISQPIEEMCPYIYENAVSPHLASKIEGNPVDLQLVKSCFENICNKYEYITVEGSGGILCPIRFDTDRVIMLEDIIKAFDIPCIIVADAGLGTINNVVLTVEYMRSKNIQINGIIFNHFHKGNIMEEDNLYMCEKLTGIKVIACVSDNCSDIDITPDVLSSIYS